MDVKQAIEEVNAAFSKAYNQGDAAGCAAVFTEDAIILPPNQPMFRGKKALTDFIQMRIDRTSGGTYSNKIVEFGVEGDLAYQVATSAVIGAKTSEQGKFVNILRRQPDGSWKIIVAMPNSNQPL
jgi:uncharacterized protein (TIGR02246 family)